MELGLSDQFAKDFAFFRGANQTLIEALVWETEAMRVDADLVQYGCLQVANTDGILGYVVPNVVGLTIRARSNATACHPHSKSVRVMIAADEAFFQILADVVLHHRRAAELAAPNDQCFIQEATLLEVGDQRRDGLISLRALDR